MPCNFPIARSFPVACSTDDILRNLSDFRTRIVHERRELGHLRPDLVGDIAPLLAGGFRCVLGEGDCDKG